MRAVRFALAAGLGLIGAASQATTVTGADRASCATLVAGVVDGDRSPIDLLSPAPSQPLAASLGSGGFSIDFDDALASCAFSDSPPLKGKYSAQGAGFVTRHPIDGASILDECSNFGVTGHSSPNFLAFNAGAVNGFGGTPALPELIRLFGGPWSHVEMRVGSGLDTGTLTLIAIDAAGNQLATSSVALTPALQTVSVDAANIAGVILTGSATVFVIDDLAAN